MPSLFEGGPLFRLAKHCRSKKKEELISTSDLVLRVRQHGMGLTTNRHKITCYFIFRTLNEENKRYLRLKSCLTAED